MLVQLRTKSLIFFIILMFSHLHGEEYEGVELFRSTGRIDLNWLPQFLPYNPIIVDAGASAGLGTIQAAKIWPKAQIYAFEPNPYLFDQLQERIQSEKLTNIEIYPVALNTYTGTASLHVCRGMKGNERTFENFSSLLPQEKDIYCVGPKLNVACVLLEDWCKWNKIEHIDLLRLELEGLELKVLQSSANILKNVKIIYVQTVIHPYRLGMTTYNELKKFLESSNFVLLSHWYTPWTKGYAIFLSRELFDAYFKLSLGIYLGL